VVVQFSDEWLLRSRPYKRHLSLQYVEDLGEFIKRIFAEPLPYPSDPGIVS